MSGPIGRAGVGSSGGCSKSSLVHGGWWQGLGSVYCASPICRENGGRSCKFFYKGQSQLESAILLPLNRSMENYPERGTASMILSSDVLIISKLSRTTTVMSHIDTAERTMR